MQPMLRFIGRGGTGAAAAGLASAPAIAECRAPTAGPSSGPLRKLKLSEPEVLSADSCSTHTWVAPDVKDGEILGFEEIQDALDDVLSVATGRSRVGSIADGAGNDDASSVESFGADADLHIEAFDTAGGAAVPQLSSVVHTLLNNVEVQRAVAVALKDSPELGSLLDCPEMEHFRPLYSSELLPPAATAALERRPADDRNVLEKGLELAAQGLASLGESIAGVGDGLAAFLGGLAASVRDALKSHGKPPCPAAEDAESRQDHCRPTAATRQALLSGALFSLAVAVIAVVLFKRAGLVRVVRAAGGRARV